MTFTQLQKSRKTATNNVYAKFKFDYLFIKVNLNCAYTNVSCTCKKINEAHQD